MDEMWADDWGGFLNRTWEKISAKAEETPDLDQLMLFYEMWLVLLGKELGFLQIGTSCRDFANASKPVRDWVLEYFSHLSESVKKRSSTMGESRLFFGQIHAYVAGMYVETLREKVRKEMPALQAAAQDDPRDQYK